jgi:uncharacterized protein YkwD
VKKFAAALIASLWAWTACLPASAQRPDIPSIEKKLLEWVNKERTDRQLNPLKLSTDLRALAKSHSHDMASRRKLTHLSSIGKSYKDRLLDAGIFFTEIGENVATSETYEGTFIHQGFMESPEHKDNILNPHFDAIGIGIVYANDNKYYVTQDFCQSLEVLDENKATQIFQNEINAIREKNGLPDLPFQKAANSFAQRHARQKANGKPLFNIANFFGETHIHFITSPTLIIPEMVGREIVKGIYESGGIGTWFGRLPDYPGGTYLVALFLFPINRYNDMTEKDFVKITLSAMNEKREENGLDPIKLDTKRSRKAQEISQLLKVQKENSTILTERTSIRQILSYVTEDLRVWPDNIDPEIIRPKLKKIGMGISSQKNEETHRQTFWITLIF